jgi:hypothetical protein
VVERLEILYNLLLLIKNLKACNWRGPLLIKYITPIRRNAFAAKENNYQLRICGGKIKSHSMS